MAQQQRAPEPPSDKLSAELLRRLARMAPDAIVRAVVLLRTDAVRATGGRRGDRQAAVQAVRRSGAAALVELAPLVQHLGGKWLAAEPDALGSIALEMPAASLGELAKSELVRAILEDQRVFAIPRAKR
jgi:hypothetical protein